MAALPPYRLEALVTLRERKKEAAERALGEAIGALKKQTDKLEQMRQELVRMEQKRTQLRREYMEKAMRGETGAQDAVRHNAYVDHLKAMEKLQVEAIAEQEDVVKEYEERKNARQKELALATQELKALEKHREKWLEELKKEMAQKEEMVMDELAQNIFLRNQADNKEGGGST